MSGVSFYWPKYETFTAPIESCKKVEKKNKLAAFETPSFSAKRLHWFKSSELQPTLIFDFFISDVEFKNPTAEIIYFVCEEKVRMKYFVEVKTVTT